ncbi:hypothetical protein BZK31_03290 [Pseudomonas floridensis]|uniref:ATPase AAA-type core domain-containing protein n=1 Tax=Pseudomonas floridensis TaxID=1958950 RepID=A0A1X0NCE2_9PSED|nr:AAA family ATPase [Pseudomonas floridensis]ORC61346.1 hypothetical protein BZK31_03290 [Pseudomonas floridensis]
MERLSVSNFLSIKKATLELKRINIFIGPQAQGKSILSKLVYYFKEFPLGILESAIEERTKRQFDSSAKDRFERIFPPYAWEGKAFLIVYDTPSYKILIENEKVGFRFKFSVTYTSSIGKALVAARKTVRSEFDTSLRAGGSIARGPVAISYVHQAIASSLLRDKLEQTIYVPAGRSFFANLQKSLFSFIASSIPIDYFIKEFGAIYENTRTGGITRQAARTRPKGVDKIVEDLLCGSHEHLKGEDWIVGARGRVNLSHASSGQQEALPMAIVLSIWPYLSSAAYTRSFVIEEPEAHLFPFAQGQVVSLIAAAYNAPGNDGVFVITTHSPYILTALNNLVQARNAASVANEKELLEIYKIVPKDQLIEFDDLAAYAVNEGGVTSILDTEYSLIQAHAIDGVSEYFASRFEKLLEIEAVAQDRMNMDLI